MKKCTVCKIEKPIIEFSKNKSRPSGRVTQCRKCNQERLKKWRDKNPDKYALLKKKYVGKYPESVKIYEESTSGKSYRLLKRCKARTKHPGRKKIEQCTISHDWIHERIKKGKCELTGIDFDLSFERKKSKLNPFSPSVDRIDSDKGYTPENSRLVIYGINVAMNEWGESIFSKIAKAYLENKK